MTAVTRRPEPAWSRRYEISLAPTPRPSSGPTGGYRGRRPHDYSDEEPQCLTLPRHGEVH